MAATMDPNAGKFITSLVKSLQMVCHGFMEFSDNIEIIGHINLRIDNRQKFDYIVNEQVSKQGGESTVFQSNSYHSLPPTKCSGGERERAFSSKFEEDGNVNNNHRLDESVAAMGSNRVQVDLSGPVPITRSTSAPTHDGFFTTAGNNNNHHHRRSQSRDSRFHSMEEEDTLASISQDHSFINTHSSSASSKDRDQMEREAVVVLASGRGGGGERGEHNSLHAMYKDTDLTRLQSLGQRQDLNIKPEPNELLNSTMDDTGGGLTRDSSMLDASSTSSILPAAHQSATLLATAAHTGHTMLAATTLGHPGFFDASLTSQDGDAGRHTLVQQALMQQIIHAQKHAQQLALPVLQSNAISLMIPKGPVDLRQPQLKQKQERKDWNHQVPSAHFMLAPQQKTEETVAEEADKTDPNHPSLPSTSSGTSLAELDPRIKDALAKKLAKRGRGRGPRKTDQVISSRKNRRQFRCSYCDYASVRRYNTERHIRLRHPSYRYRCPQCGQILLDDSELRIHLQGHSTAAQFLLQCHDCAAVCPDYDSLISHQNSCPTTNTTAATTRAAAVATAAAVSASHSGSVMDEEGGDGEDQVGVNFQIQGSCDAGVNVGQSSRGCDMPKTVVVDLNEEENKDGEGDRMGEGGCGEEGGGGGGCRIDDNASEGDDESIEIVDDDNLPVHFMVKEEEEEQAEDVVGGSPESSSS